MSYLPSQHVFIINIYSIFLLELKGRTFAKNLVHMLIFDTCSYQTALAGSYPWLVARSGKLWPSLGSSCGDSGSWWELLPRAVARRGVTLGSKQTCFSLRILRQSIVVNDQLISLLIDFCFICCAFFYKTILVWEMTQLPKLLVFWFSRWNNLAGDSLPALLRQGLVNAHPQG